MTYNIRECKGWVTPDSANETNALSAVAEVIRGAGADVVCLQEVVKAYDLYGNPLSDDRIELTENVVYLVSEGK